MKNAAGETKKNSHARSLWDHQLRPDLRFSVTLCTFAQTRRGLRGESDVGSRLWVGAIDQGTVVRRSLVWLRDNQAATQTRRLGGPPHPDGHCPPAPSLPSSRYFPSSLGTDCSEHRDLAVLSPVSET